MFRSRVLLCASLAVAACALLVPTAQALRPAAPRDLVQLDVIDRDDGRVLPRYRHRGESWIAGQPGTPYSLRLRNITGERVLVVVSVDGINAVSGQTAAPDQTGYVLEPWQQTEITGWRKSHDEVARFEFAALAQSYAARTGRPDHVGVIGIAVFRERPAPPPVTVTRAPRVRDTAERAAGDAASPVARESVTMSQQIGTAHGAREWSPSGRTRFERATRTPQQQTAFRYDSVDALAALGIVPRRLPLRGRPHAFPATFVPDP